MTHLEENNDRPLRKQMWKAKYIKIKKEKDLLQYELKKWVHQEIYKFLSDTIRSYST